MERKRSQRETKVRVLVVTGLTAIERVLSWEVALVRDRIEAIVRGEEEMASAEVGDAR